MFHYACRAELHSFPFMENLVARIDRIASLGICPFTFIVTFLTPHCDSHAVMAFPFTEQYVATVVSLLVLCICSLLDK
jgi:hypothetical protein